MQIVDIYGNFEIKEQILLDLIKSKPVQRLKQVAQAGISRYYLKNRTNSRFDHSIGVMLILRYFNVPIEEQIAGLIHDVSHTAFSHVVDFVFENDKHDYHEKIFEKVIYNSEIPKILKKYGFGEEVLDVENSEKFPLLEQEIPEVCADRIDYSVRDSITYGHLSKQDAKKFLSNIVIFDQQMVFKDKNVAYDFAKNFLFIFDSCYNRLEEVALYKLFAEVLRQALNKAIITEDDLLKNDLFVLKKLKASKDKEVLSGLARLENLKVVESKDDFDFHVKNKFRYVDPKVIVDGSIFRLSELYPQYKEEILRRKKKAKEGFKIKVL